MEKIASALIVIGAIYWAISIVFFESDWQQQLIAAAITIVGIFVAHLWEELFRDQKK